MQADRSKRGEFPLTTATAIGDDENYFNRILQQDGALLRYSQVQEVLDLKE